MLVCSGMVCSFFPNNRPGDRATLPKIGDIPRSNARLVSSGPLPILSGAFVRCAGVEVTRHFPGHADASTQPATTFDVAWPGRSRNDLHERADEGFAGEADRTARQ